MLDTERREMLQELYNCRKERLCEVAQGWREEFGGCLYSYVQKRNDLFHDDEERFILGWLS